MKRLPLLACLATAVLLSAVVHSQNEGAPIEPLLKNLTPAPIPPPERMAAPEAFGDAPAAPDAPDAPETPQSAGGDATPAPAPKAVIAAPAPEIAAPAPEIAVPAPEIATSAPEIAAPAPEIATSAPEIAAQPARVTVATESDELPVGVTETPDGLISVRFEELPMSEVIKLFSQISGANIIAATTNLNGTVTASLKNVGWKPAFESILSRH